MEQEHPSGPEPTQPIEPEESAEVEPKSAIDALPEALGFVETEELSQLRGQMTESKTAGTSVKELITRYLQLAEEVVNQYEGDDFARAQIGLIVQMGLIRRDGGINEVGEDLLDALTYAEGIGLVDVVAVLEEALGEQA